MLIHINDAETKKAFRDEAKAAVTHSVREAIAEVLSSDYISNEVQKKINIAFEGIVHNWSTTTIRQEFLKIINKILSNPDFIKMSMAELITNEDINQKFTQALVKGLDEYVPKALVDLFSKMQNEINHYKAQQVTTEP
jgi:hypothetical protein